MCIFIHRHLDEGYTQGQCDIAGPLLCILQDEALTVECFEKVMERMKTNFPTKIPSSSNGIDINLNLLRTLVQMMDVELYEHIMNSGDHTHM